MQNHKRSLNVNLKQNKTSEVYFPPRKKLLTFFPSCDIKYVYVYIVSIDSNIIYHEGKPIHHLPIVEHHNNSVAESETTHNK